MKTVDMPPNIEDIIDNLKNRIYVLEEQIKFQDKEKAIFYSGFYTISEKLNKVLKKYDVPVKIRPNGDAITQMIDFNKQLDNLLQNKKQGFFKRFFGKKR